MFLRSPDSRFAFGIGIGAACASSILLLIFLFMAGEALPALKNVGVQSFLFDDAWYPTDGSFGVGPMLVSSLVLAVGAILVAGPVGVAAAVYRLYYAPSWIRQPYRWLVLLLAGMPSVVLGLWGLVVLVPLIARIEPPGTSLIAGILVVSLMVVPTVTIMSESALEGVTRSSWFGAAALGFSREATLWHLILPAARGGIAAGILLAAARAIGETMVVLMVTGNIVQMPEGPFTSVRVLTSNIALEMAYATGDHRAALFVSGLVLTILVLLLSLAAVRATGLKNNA